MMRASDPNRFARFAFAKLLVVCVVVGAVAGLFRTQSAYAVAPAPTRSFPPGSSDGDANPNALIFPQQSIQLRFNHAMHAALHQTCSDCHVEARTSTKASDRLLPDVARCDRCHGTDHAKIESVRPGTQGASSCGYCHVGHSADQGNKVARTVIPTPQIKSNHKAHAARNIGCGQCHGAVYKVGLATRDQLPRMKGCLKCHDLPPDARGDARTACTTCHLTDVTGKMQTHLSGGKLEPPRWMANAQHDAGFLERHKRVAGDNSRLCAQCHTEEQCAKCHDSRVRPRSVHPNDFLSMHAVAARQNSPRCSSCHQTQGFCQPCHMRSGVSMSGPGVPRSQQGRFHPPASVFTNGPRNNRHHAWEAQRNLSACVSCHTESDCASCHATRRGGGAGVSPHGVGFLSRCASGFRRNPRPCLVCHMPDDPILAPCR